MRIALVQMDCTPLEADNLQKALRFLQAAKKKKADLVLLPELFNTGYYLDGMQQKAKTQDGPSFLEEAAERLGVSILAGMPERRGGTLYNAAWWFEPGTAGGSVPLQFHGPPDSPSRVRANQNGRRVVYRKVNLFPGTPISEKGCFTAGKSVTPLETPWGTLGLQICMDLRYPDGSRRLAERGAQVLAYLSAFPHVRIHQWLALLKARAIENQCFVAGCNRVGTDSIQMGGQSAIFGPQGELLGQLNGKEQGVLLADLDFSKVKTARKALPLW